LRETEEVARGPTEKHFWGDGKRSLRAAGVRADVEDGGVAGVKNAIEGDRHSITIVPGAFDLETAGGVFSFRVRISGAVAKW
jgi:hypothetical protein